ncbi:MAG: zinc ribbon domain-containing protein, partial [Actinomycetota bacterium]|nr:zinc ribbon domain-containing protein [Actinomycetota bacterium]
MTGKSVPSATPETRQYWEHTAQGEIWMPSCNDHGWVFPPRPHCPKCGKRPLDWMQLSGKGTIASFI